MAALNLRTNHITATITDDGKLGEYLHCLKTSNDPITLVWEKLSSLLIIITRNRKSDTVRWQMVAKRRELVKKKSKNFQHFINKINFENIQTYLSKRSNSDTLKTI